MTLDEMISDIDYVVNKNQLATLELGDESTKQLLHWLEDYKRLQSVSSWIPCNERMPENAGKPGAFCAKHLIMKKFGITEGWFNPDFDCWFALVWFYTSRFLDEEISMERADVPKVCRLPKSYVSHWRDFPDSPHRGDAYEKD